jgi:ABC-2 type transport system ATP-binding protein
MPGEIYGFIGPNGAGKTTTMRLLLNFIQPTYGQALVNGYNTVKEPVAVKRSCGYLSGDLALYPKMTGRQLLSYLADLQPPKKASYVKELTRMFHASLDVPIHSLSKGNRQKIGIIQAFAHQPEVLILDEPTSGLDPLMQEAFFELVRTTKERGATIFISSHNLTEVQKICDRVGFIRGGKLIAQQKIEDFVKRAVQTYDISFNQPAPIAELNKIAGVKASANTSKHATVVVKGHLKPLLTALTKFDVTSIDRREDSLENEFLRFYKGAKQ